MASGNRIIIVNGEKVSATILYRSQAAARCLKKLGLVVDVHGVDDIDRVSLEEVTTCLFIRTPLTPTVGAFIERLKSLSIVVLADFDDLIFRPDLLHLFDGIKYLSKDERELFAERTLQFQEMIRIADCIVVTTLPLATEVARYNDHVRVVRNYPLAVTRDISILSHVKDCNADKFVIGYYSGTLTHQADFKQCAGALARLMERRSDVWLRVVGKMRLGEFPELTRFESRIVLLPMMSYKDMLLDMRGCDLNLAPLEGDNVFCDCKSELKYFDAALMCVPTIASPTKPFKAAIKHGVNGYLAGINEDWEGCFETILKNRAMARHVGLNARRHVLSFFGEAAQLNDYVNLMRHVFGRIRV